MNNDIPPHQQKARLVDKLPEDVVHNVSTQIMLTEEQADAKLHELAGLFDHIQPVKSVAETDAEQHLEWLGFQVARGLTLEQSCLLLSPKPNYYAKVLRTLKKKKYDYIYKRAQAFWLSEAIKVLLTRPPRETAGLIFILRNRHTELFDGGQFKLDVTSAGSPLQLTSPEVIARAREYAKAIDIEVSTEQLSDVKAEKDAVIIKNQLQLTDNKATDTKYLESLLEENNDENNT
jgi:hypothetical protein